MSDYSPWTSAFQAPLSSTIPRSLLQLMSVESAMLSNHLILCQRIYVLELKVYEIYRLKGLLSRRVFYLYYKGKQNTSYNRF